MRVLLAMAGLLTGGLINWLADVLPQRTRRWHRPACAYCGQSYDAWRWLAVVGYLSGHNRCAHCAAPLPTRSVLVELGLAVFFPFLGGRYGLTRQLAVTLFYVALFVLIAVIDLEHRLVLNVVILPSLLLALLLSLWYPGLGFRQAVLGGATGLIAFYLIALAWPGAMGAGDVTLATFVGLVTGFPLVILALLITIFVGGITSLLLVIIRVKSLKSYVPYGPFLVIGGLVTLIWGPEIVRWYLH